VSPERYIANLQSMTVDDLIADYVSGAETPAIAAARKQIATAAKYVEQSATLRVRAQLLRINGSLGYVSSTEPAYRLSLDDARVRLENFSNRASQGESQLAVDGSFMGSGATRIRGVLRPGKDMADFALDARVLHTDMTRLNDLLRAHAKLDVSAGTMSVFSQVQVSNGRVRGYVKPLFRDLQIYEPQDDDDKNVFHRLYEAVAEAISKMLENQPREEIATVVDVSGPLKNPHASTLQILGNLLRNAFVQAILPGFEAGRAPTGKPRSAGSGSSPMPGSRAESSPDPP
jgi:hypothetical protein